MIKELNPTYATWQQVVVANRWPQYHVNIAADAVIAFSGNNRIQYRTQVAAENYATWAATFPDSTEVAAEDDARTLLLGLYDVPGEALTRDGRRVSVQFPAREGWNTWFHSAGDADATPAGRGTGTAMTVSWELGEDGPSGSAKTKSVEFSVAEPIWIHDGQGILWPPPMRTDSSWRPTDRLRFYVRMPATEVSGTGTLDVVAVDTGTLAGGAPSGAYTYIPQGHPVLALLGDPVMTHRLVTPVPILRIEERDGFWHLDEDTGVVTPATDGQAGNCLLIDSAVYGAQISSIWLGQGHGVLDIDVAKSEYLHPSWVVCMEVTKDSVATIVGQPLPIFSAWLLSYRQSAQILP